MAWKFQAKDKDGKVVDASPGHPFFFCRGAESKQDMIRGANILLNNKRLDAVRFGFPDPGYRLDIQSMIYVEENVNDLGAGPLPDLTSEEGKEFLPTPGLSPINLPLDDAVNAAHEKLIAEQGG